MVKKTKGICSRDNDFLKICNGKAALTKAVFFMPQRPEMI
jgi:hypothetical protein